MSNGHEHSLNRHEFYPHDPRLDWRPSHDERSENYPIRALLGSAVEERPKQWGVGPVLDQGREGACVGFAWTAELMASPKPDPDVSGTRGNAFARDVYYQARRIDEWPGESYEGTSVLAGAKVLQSQGRFDQYRWAFSVDDIRDAICAPARDGGGPVVIGIPWYEQMYQTTQSGLVRVGGDMVGGHAILVYGYHPGMRIRGEDWNARHRVFRWRNSWGPAYGKGGNGLIRYEDLRDLLKSWGEACVPVSRNTSRI